jgi:hypothetical protein
MYYALANRMSEERGDHRNDETTLGADEPP